MPASTASRTFLLILVIAITAVFLAMIRSFLMALLLAGIFASLAQPAYRRVLRWCRGRRSPAAILTLVLVVLVIFLPLGAFLGVVTAQALKVGETLTAKIPAEVHNLEQLQAWFAGLPLVGKLQTAFQDLPFADQIGADRQSVLEKTTQIVQWLSEFVISNLSAATTGTLRFFLMLGIMLYSMFFFLKDGGRLVDLILSYLPMAEAEKRGLLEKFRSVTRATIKGSIVIGILQGGLAGLAFAAVGLPSAVFWGTLMVVLSVIPGIGAALVWVPAVVILVAAGRWADGIGLAAFCGLVVSTIDNFLRPRLVGKDTKLPDLLVMLGTLGGIMMFGVLGFIIGPIVAALFVAVWEIYGAVFKDALARGGTDPRPPLS